MEPNLYIFLYAVKKPNKKHQKILIAYFPTPSTQQNNIRILEYRKINVWSIRIYDNR